MRKNKNLIEILPNWKLMKITLMMSLAEVELFTWLSNKILHFKCTQNQPCILDSVVLLTMRAINKRFFVQKSNPFDASAALDVFYLVQLKCF